MKKTILTLIVLANVLTVPRAQCDAQTKYGKEESKQTSSASSQTLRAPLTFGLEDGTPIRMRITRTISSADAKIDEKVDFEVLEEIKVGDVVVVPRGGIAWATVTEAQPKRRLARGGKLNVNIDAVRLTSGEKAPLRAVKEMKGGGHTGAMTGAIVATSIVFFPAAPLFLFMHGKDITIPKGTEITAYINGDISLDPAKFSAESNQRTIATNAAPAANTVELSTVAIKSNPDGADIMIDGKFVGNAPSTVRLTAGEHVLRIEKSGFKAWQRQISINSAGSINVEGVLEKAESGETASSPPNQPLSRAKNNEPEGGVVSNPETGKSVAAIQDPPKSSKSEAPPAIVNLRPFPDSHKATSAGTPNKNTREATTEFGKEREYLLFAITLTDHLERCRAEKARDVEAYNKLKDSGRLREVRNHTKVLILDSKKDTDGEEVFEVRIPATGKTVWIEHKLLK